jgi:uroporphyrinogen-III synthase
VQCAPKAVLPPLHFAGNFALAASITPTVLIPQEEPEPFAEMLQARGLNPMHLPLIRRRPTDCAPPTLSCELLLFTSAATLHFCTNLPAVPAIAVGEATARSLRSAGYPVVAIGDRGGAEAAHLALSVLSPSGRVWLVGAEDLAPPLAHLLQQEPFSSRFSHWAVYRTERRKPMEHELSQSWDIVCFTSPSTVDAYVAAGLVPHAPNARLLAIGATTAARIIHYGLPTPEIAARPALFALADLAQHDAPKREADSCLDEG